jgi:nitrate reductase delta subunit
MSQKRPAPSWTPEQLSRTWQAASLLLGYPDQRLRADLPVIGAVVATLPDELADPLESTLALITDTPLGELQPAYVETFDSRRRTNLFLTYFAHGDTRKRGVALLRFKQTYLRSGYLLEEHGGELPDHLCVVLEYGAAVVQQLGWGLLLDHRAGLELLRMALTQERSPWAGAVEAVCATLPPLRGDEREAVRRLAAEGPPAEEVGLDAYGGPAFDPALQPAGGPVDLPMPGVGGVR